MQPLSHYQLLIHNRADVPLEDIALACKELQAFCLYAFSCNEELKLLEQLVMVYYEKLYPDTRGGIFEPLSKTIGYTHCHYLHAQKFPTFDENKYRAKINLLTNYIEDVPDALQPITIGELIHMIHLIARLQNTYYDKHLAAAALHNKEHMIGGRFSIENESLVILFEMPEHEAEILLSSRDSFPMLQYNKNLFADYLNTRGNKALQEVMYSEYTLPQLRNFLEKSPVEFHVGEYSQTLSNEYDNIHFTRGLLNLQRKTDKDREDVIELYQVHLDEYIERDDAFQQVYCITNSREGITDHAFAPLHDELRRLFKERYDNYYDYSPDIMIPAPSPDQIIAELKRGVRQGKEDNILIVIGLHGEKNGSATYAGGSFTKDHFQELFDMSAYNPRIQLLIMSCRSSKKTDSLVGNVIMSSSEQVSYVSYTKAFLRSFEKGESLYQAHLLAMAQYNQSLLPTSYCNEFGEVIELCPVNNSAQPHTYSAYM